MSLTGNKGVDVAIEAVGVPETFELCESIIAPGGRIANVGVHGNSVALHLETLWSKKYYDQHPPGRYGNYCMVLKTVASKKLDPAKLTSHHFPWKDIIKAYDVFQNAAQEKTLKVILTNE